MQSGYRYDRPAAAKALKSAVRNSKKDKVLYGAVIKSEGVFSTTITPGIPPPQPPTPPPNQPPPPAGQPNAARPPSNPNTPPSPHIGVHSRGVHPLAAMLTGKTALKKTNHSPPKPQDREAPFDQASLDSAISKLKKTDQTIRPNPFTSAPETFEKKLQALKEKREAKAQQPVDTRKSNVEVTTPAIPSLKELAESARIKAKNTTTNALERRFDTLKPTKGTPSTAPTSPLSTTPSIQYPEPSLATANPPTSPKKYDPHSEEIQSKAFELFTLVQEARVKAGEKSTKQTTITPFTYAGNQISDRIIIKLEPRVSKLRFDLKHGGSIMKDNKGIDLLTSIKNALDLMKKSRYNVNRRTGEMSGLGIDSDPEKIGSQRVVYSARKDGKHVKKGQLYIMEPQLIKGHIRLYNKSGRPVVSRSNVSPSFQRMAKDIVERNTFESDDFSTLDPKETADANKFIEATKPIQPRNINRLSNADTVWQLKKRYEVLVGELSAGNTGKLVRDEMESILRNLIRLHAMNVDKGRELIRSLREF